MKETIARQMLESIMYDNDMVNREEPLDESRLQPWVDKVAACLEAPIAELGESFFTDDWIESFCCGDADDQTVQIDLHPCLKELSETLDLFFEEY